mgnify:CR=1 FL=1
MCQGKTQLGGGGSLERREREHGQVNIQQGLSGRLRQPLDAAGRHQIDQQRQRRLRQDLSSRDLGATTQSLNDFAEVVRRYPNSRYAPDARQRMIYLRNQLARHEINVGLYYLQRDAFVAAANRGKYILQTYPQSEHDGDALALMASAYTALGQDELAANSRKVLETNYPQHPYLSGDWPDGQGILSKLNPFSGQ